MLLKKANMSSAMQSARNEYEMYLAEYAEELKGNEEFVIVSGDYYFEVTAGQFKSEALDWKDPTKATYAKAVDLSAYKVVEQKAKLNAGDPCTYSFEDVAGEQA